MRVAPRALRRTAASEGATVALASRPSEGRLELELHAAVRRHARRGPAQHVGVPYPERRKRRVALDAVEA